MGKGQPALLTITYSAAIANFKPLKIKPPLLAPSWLLMESKRRTSLVGLMPQRVPRPPLADYRCSNCPSITIQGQATEPKS